MNTSHCLLPFLFSSALALSSLNGGDLGKHLRLESASPELTRPAEAIQDNSFFIEEAYNQEAGVVQHIFTGFGSINKLRGKDDRDWALSFTQEWPVFSQAHQFSYTVPYSVLDSAVSNVRGLGDILLNYRFQLFTETSARPALAPRFSVILPIGDEGKGLGDGTVGFQLNLPLSKVVSDRTTVHANAGVTVLPDVAGRDLVSYNLGASAIYALTPAVNLMLECVGNFDEAADEAGGLDHSVSALISPGVRYGINLPKDAQLVIGIAAPIGLTGETPDYGIFLYASFEHFFHRAKPSPVLSLRK